MAPRRLRVFLGYTEELAEFPAERPFARAAAEAVRAAGAIPVEPGTGPDRWRHLDDTDLVLLVVGFRPGVDSGSRPLGDLDLDRATRAGLPHVEVLLGEDVVGPARVFLDRSGTQLPFRARLADRPTVSTPDDLYDAVLDIVTHHRRLRGDTAHRVLRRLPPEPAHPVLGREDLLDRLWRERSPSPRLLTGPPGIGKTTVAAAYVHRHSDAYDVVWWIPCSLPEAIPLALAELARALGSPHDDVPAAVEDLRSLLRRPTGRYLLVLDDLDDPDLARHVLDSPVEVLITTSNLDLDLGLPAHPVTRLTKADSTRLLRDTDKLTSAQTRRLSKGLQGLPLALSATATTLRFSANTDPFDTLSTERNVGQAAAGLLVNTLWRRAESVAHTLTLAAWLGGERVPISLLNWELEVMPRRVTPLRGASVTPGWFQFYFSGLGTLSVIGRSDDATVTLHPVLVEELRAASVNFGGADAWVSAAAEVLLSEIQGDTGENALGWDQLIRSALVIHDRVKRLRSVHRPVVTLLRAASSYLDEVGMDDLSDRILRDVRMVERSGHSVEQAVALDVLARPAVIRGDDRGVPAEIALAVSLREAGNHYEAVTRLERLAETTTGQSGDDDPIALAVLAELATTLHGVGQHKRATALRRRVVESSERIYGRSHPRTLTAKTDLAADYLDQGDHNSAFVLAEETFDRIQVVLGADHPDTLHAASTLAAALAASGDVAAARDLDEYTFQRYRFTLGKDDPATLLAANNLAGDLRLLGDLDRARDLDRDTVERLRRVLGPDHPDTVRVAENLALDERLLAEARSRRAAPRRTKDAR
ncbi:MULTISPECIES: tetratricopeptide repeat protein [unclassified Saccharothrix]|uniref:tetratricopeptide repeat protein n=1 Tax=unclassified Saccharothrix TaxID=2593673 RepID=UPI00307E978B